MGRLTRRQFICAACGAAAAAVGGYYLRNIVPAQTPQQIVSPSLKEAMHYDQLGQEAVLCKLCYRKCLIQQGNRGTCNTRENRRGKLHTMVYGKTAATHIDPIEKLPLYHMRVGSTSLCSASAGCNFHCLNCINWSIALKTPEEVETVTKSPVELVQTAKENGAGIIAFTYNEPTMFYEYIYDVFKLARAAGIKTCFHTNATMNTKPLEDLSPYINSVVADLKAFSNETYQNLTSGELEPVLRFLKDAKRLGLWLEIVHLVVPTITDDDKKIGEMSKWIASELGSETPLHLSRFFPSYKLERLSATPLDTMTKAYETAKKSGLKFVYMGNVPGQGLADTYCPNCRRMLIQRKQFAVYCNDVKEGKCKYCGNPVPGAW